MSDRHLTPSALNGVKTVRVVLVDREGRVVRRVPTPNTTTFILNLKDGHYYDRQPCCGRFMRRA